MCFGLGLLLYSNSTGFGYWAVVVIRGRIAASFITVCS